MTSEAPPAQITCPKCDVLSAPDSNYCGYRGASLTDMIGRDYECAVGSAILALNSLESAVFYLLDILGAAPPSLEGAYFMVKVRKLEDVARQHGDAKIRGRLEKIASEACRLANDRNNFAHGLLWIDGFTGEHKRTFVRRDGKVIEDARSPEVIERIAFDLIQLSLDVRDLAMQLGGLERWEEYYDQYLAPLLARRDQSSAT
jgi:hypothetical protein